MSPHDLERLCETYQGAPAAEREAALVGLLEQYQAGHALNPEGHPLLTEEGGRVLARLTQMLREPIERAALQTVHRAGCWESDPRLAEELRTDALAEVLLPRQSCQARICSWRPSLGSLLVWLRTVLANVLRDRLRRKSKLEQLAEGEEKQLPGWELAPEELCEPWSERFDSPFAPADLEELANWPVRLRIELLCLAGLAHKVPDRHWDEWLTDWERQAGRPLPRPFPPPAFLTLDEPRFRLRPLAALLGCTPNTLSQRWSRHRPRFSALEFVRNLQPT